MNHYLDSFSWLPRLHQLFDTAFPNGGYAHSYGLEGLVQDGEICSEDDLIEFSCQEFADSLISTELPLFRLAYQAFESGELARISELDQLSWAVRPTRELRESASSVGRQTYRIFGRIIDSQGRNGMRLARVGEHFLRFQSVVVLGSLAALLEIPLSAALTGYCQQLVAGWVIPAVKLMQFGPAQVQRIQFELGSKTAHWVEQSLLVAPGEIGTVSPRWDVASARHEFAERRLFIS